jgi:hypothetical protein
MRAPRAYMRAIDRDLSTCQRCQIQILNYWRSFFYFTKNYRMSNLYVKLFSEMLLVDCPESMTDPATLPQRHDVLLGTVSKTRMRKHMLPRWQLAVWTGS